MPVPKEKVSAVLETRFKGKLTKNFIDGIAEKWAGKIDTDEEIDTYVENHSDVLTLTASEADRRATQAAAKARTDAAKAAGGDQSTDTPPAYGDQTKTPSDMPAWAKEMMDTISTLKATHTQQTTNEKLKSDPRTKDIPAWYLDGKQLPDPANFDTWATEQRAKFDGVMSDFKLQGYEGGMPAPAAPGGGGKVKEASKEELDALASAMNI